MTRVLSCIQATGEGHLGNHLGALRHWVTLQHERESFHGIVDLHSLTVTMEPGVLGQRTMALAAMLFAVGLDPNVATVFVQSHVPEHPRLAWVMECTISYGELSRMTQFKVKSSRGQTEFVSGGLFTYPALMAADILLYDTDEVPVGDDQRQHVEITRDAAERFNSRFGETLVVPKATTPPAGARIMDLQDPASKMSKSTSTEAGAIGLLDDAAAIERKFRRAVTDSLGQVAYDPERQPGVSNLLEVLAAVTDRTPAAVASEYQAYGPLKADTGAAVIEMLAPIQARYLELMKDPAELARLLRIGSARAHEVAAATLDRVHSAIGLLPP
ncbi:tryptophan--tRNA ligase [soil metagenome]